MKKIVFPTFTEEIKLWEKNKLVIGIDEVGRGALAGPLVAAAVAFTPNQVIPDGVSINDSKKLSAKQREKAAVWIKKNCLSWGIGETSVLFINKYGIVKATHAAFRKAIKMIQLLHSKYLLVDAFYIKYVKGIGLVNQKAIIKGDEKSYSIAAASIIAKVYRDNLMRDLGVDYKSYNWNSNKGYGTKNHIDTISRIGGCKYHRLAFISHIAYNKISYDKTG
ncbi:ribonuclease HII [Candidatus Gottesmanbacteria bacterium]|nr:ribonuclease HII [Candidatus Gottesmanbacteria bacterium]